MLRYRRTGRKRRPGGLQSRYSRSAFICLSVAVLLTTALLTGCATAALSNDPKNLFARAEPATVLVQGQVGAHISTPGEWIVNESKIRDALYAEGLTEDSAAWDSERFNLIVTNPIEYLDPDYSSAPYETDTSAAWSGSGFIADPNGYIVTNAHVAAPPDDEIKADLVSQGLQTFIDRDVAMWVKKGNTADQLKQLAAADQQWMTHYLTVTNLTKKFSVVMGANIAGSDVTPKEITADVVTAGAPIPGKDVAILKIEGQNYPTVPIGDDTQSNVGDKLYVIGYPGVAQGGVNEVISTKSITEPTFTSGVVSAKKQATEGFQVIQTDAAVTHGNSGGPVLNGQGQVVGIATFGSVDPSTGQEIQGYNFIMPSTLIKQFLDRSGAHPAPGEFTTLYTRGLAQEASSQYKAANATFQQISRLSPGNPYIQQHISRAEAAIAAGKDQSLLGTVRMIGIGVVMLVVVGVGVAILVVALRRKPAEQATNATASGALPSPGVQAAATGHTDDLVTLLVTTPSGTRQIGVGLPAIIGQGADCQISLDDPEVSDHHAALARLNGVLEVTDLGGRNGLQVNDSTVVMAPLQQADRIKLGRSELVIE